MSLRFIFKRILSSSYLSLSQNHENDHYLSIRLKTYRQLIYSFLISVNFIKFKLTSDGNNKIFNFF